MLYENPEVVLRKKRRLAHFRLHSRSRHPIADAKTHLASRSFFSIQENEIGGSFLLIISTIHLVFFETPNGTVLQVT
jgi:hypothetical protein